MQLCPYTQCGIDIGRFEKTGEEKKEGGFATFYIVKEKESGKKYGAKVLRGKMSEQNLNREIGILMIVNHPTIVKFYGFSLKDLNQEKNVTLLLELAPNGSLLDILTQNRNNQKPPTYDNTNRQLILVGVCRGMKYLHDRNIVHRDLKPGNVLMNENFEPLITDFGMSKFFEVDHSDSGSQFGGTPYYMAPEVITRSSFGRKADVYAFGILMYEVITDLIPYPDVENRLMNIQRFKLKVVQNYRPKFTKPIKESLKNLIERCWSADPDERPSFSELFKKLSTKEESENNDYFLDDVNVDKINEYVEKITKIDDPIEVLNHTIENKDNEISHLKIHNDQLTNENQQLKTENDELPLNIEQLKNDNESLSADLDQLKKYNVQLNKENEQIKNEYKELSRDKEQLENDYKKQLNRYIVANQKLITNQNLNDFVDFNCYLTSMEFQMLKSSNNGTFGYSSITEKTNNIKQKYVTKISYKGVIIDDELSRYIEALTKIKNLAILEYEYITQKNILNENHLTIATKYMRKGSLKNIISRENSIFEEDKGRTLKYINILGIALGMEYLHSKNIVHGNLKLSNIILDEEYFPHISDFGLFKITNNDNLNQESLTYIAPEILEGKTKEPTIRSDVYSYSLIVYSIITNRLPNNERTVYEELNNIISGKRPDITCIKEPEIKTFLEQCWSPNPKDRPTFDQIISILSDSKICSIFSIYIPLVTDYLEKFKPEQEINLVVV